MKKETLSAKRVDIQALRGWAVSIVVLEHAGIGLFSSGFLGVDIFFVISGFLITGNILRSLDDDRFSLSDFYFKRARRILPAAFVTIALTSLGSIWFLTSLEMDALRDQVIGALTYTINFVLWNQVDYFAVDAKLKPLLHMWSLAIEEQFYFLLPILLWLSPPALRKWGIILATVASFLFCIWWVSYQPVGAFYMLPSRAWELGIGSCAALIAKKVRLPKPVFWVAILTIAAAPFATADFTHPGWMALAVCMATAAIILAAHENAVAARSVRFLSSIGDVSYSLYLVHWPVMVFAYSAYVGDAPSWLPAVTIPLCLALAIGMHHFVEEPCRKVGQASISFAVLTLAATFVVAGIYFGSAAYAKPEQNFRDILSPNQGFDRSCDYSGQKELVFEGKCQNSDNPEILIWGDSYAMHLVDGLAQYYKVKQATFSSCTPFIGAALKRVDMDSPEDWSRRCIAFNDSVLEYVVSTSSIRVVVLASPWRVNIDPKNIHWVRNGTDLDEVAGSPSWAAEELLRVVGELETNGKKVVLVGPPPLARNMANCLERVATQKVMFGECQLRAASALKTDIPVRALLEEVAAGSTALLLMISDALCDAEFCKISEREIPIYRDHGHLSKDGSKVVFENMRDKGLLAILDQ